MRFVLASDHISFFQQHHWLELEGFIEPKEIESAQEHARKTMASRLQTRESELSLVTPISLFQAGRDLFASDDFFKKLSTHKRYAQYFSEIAHVHPIKLACDQYLTHTTGKGPLPYPKAISLKDAFCYQPILGGLLVCLSTMTAISGSGTHHPGNIVVLHPTKKLPLNAWLQEPGFSALLIVYGNEKTLYVHQKLDPQTHVLKRNGLVFGDHLPNGTHPILVH